MASEVVFALWFFLPAGVANMAPVVVAQLPALRQLDAPLDFGARIGGTRLFGEHKTWRGLAAGIIAAIAAVLLQQYMVRQYGWFERVATEVNYLDISAFLLGLALAVGALGGDAIESFAKRRRNIPSGRPWLPYDIIDHIVGAMLLALPFVVFNWLTYIIVAVLWAAANFAVSYTASQFGIKERPM